jgi:TolB-like protein/Flp pilus assembly protein TadD
MPSEEPDVQAVRRQLERVLASASFSRGERMARFLRFVVERHLEGRDGELKESVIAVEVFDRSPNHDSKQDSIVRTEAARLRARLTEYYVGEGKCDAVVIELPKGGYVPVLREALAPGPGLAPPQSRPGKRIWLGAALAGVTLATAVGWSQFHQSAPIPIAVLPLLNLSNDPANDYFADGLTSDIIRNLSIIDGLAVRSQTSSFAFKGKPQKAGEAGMQLAADYILEGSILRSGRQLRVDAQLVRVRDDVSLWSERYERELNDVFVIQDEISRGIVNSLRVKLGRGRRRYETSVEAYDLYLRARAEESQTGTYDRAAGLFREAIEKDPSFAPAYEGLAAAFARRAGTFGSNQTDELSKIKGAAEKAIQLDPMLAEAHSALGELYAREGQWERSERSFRRSIEIDPNRGMSYVHFAGDVLLPTGRVKEAIQKMRVAEKADPLSAEVHFYLAWVLLSGSKYDEAAGHCQQLPDEYKFKRWCLGRARLGQGRIEEAIWILQADAYDGEHGSRGYALARAGRRDEAEKVASAALDPFAQALIFAGLGDKDRTFEALDRATALGAIRIGRVLTFPEYGLLRGDPRLKALRRKVGLPDSSL